MKRPFHLTLLILASEHALKRHFLAFYLFYICATLPSQNPMTKLLKKQLPLWVKLLYGSGDWGISSIGMMRSIFYAIYLTDVVGLEPRLASYGALIGIVHNSCKEKSLFIC